MINLLKNLWRPRIYHVEYFLGAIGMCSYHDKKVFRSLDKADERLHSLLSMTDEELNKEGIVGSPAFMRVLEVISPNPIRRLLNKFGSKRLYKIGPFRI